MHSERWTQMESVVVALRRRWRSSAAYIPLSLWRMEPFSSLSFGWRYASLTNSIEMRINKMLVVATSTERFVGIILLILMVDCIRIKYFQPSWNHQHSPKYIVFCFSMLSGSNKDRRKNCTLLRSTVHQVCFFQFWFRSSGIFWQTF